MLKKVKFVILALVAFSFYLGGNIVQAEEDLLALTQAAGYAVTEEDMPKGAIVISADTGQILYDRASDTLHDPASTTKAMVAYLTLQAIADGKISMDSQVVANDTDQSIAAISDLSNTAIESGVSYTVRELLYMTMIPSSNVATLMLAHAIHTQGDASFIDLMNQTARDLGMTQTNFTNATGATAESFEGHYQPEGYNPTVPSTSTAKDMAILAYYLLKDYPAILEFTNHSQITIKEGTAYEQTLVSVNHSLASDEMGISGVDGLKTGSSPTANYNTIVTASRGDIRLICVIFGASQWGNEQGEYIRHYFANALLERIFSTYSKQVVVAAGEQEIDGQRVNLSADLYGLVATETPTLTLQDNKVVFASTIDTGYGVDIVEEQAFSQKQTRVPLVVILLFLLPFPLYLLLRSRIYRKK